MNVRKRILSVIAAAAMLGSACFSAGVPLGTFTAPAAISASAADNGVLSWTESENGVTINGFVDGVTMTSLEIPDTLGGKPVVAIGLTAFREKTELESVVIPKGVTMIGAQAFKGCSRLKHVELPEGLVQILSSAFLNCALSEIKIPESVTEIKKIGKSVV